MQRAPDWSEARRRLQQAPAYRGPDGPANPYTAALMADSGRWTFGIVAGADALGEKKHLGNRAP